MVRRHEPGRLTLWITLRSHKLILLLVLVHLVLLLSERLLGTLRRRRYKVVVILNDIDVESVLGIFDLRLVHLCLTHRKLCPSLVYLLMVLRGRLALEACMGNLRWCELTLAFLDVLRVKIGRRLE